MKFILKATTGEEVTKLAEAFRDGIREFLTPDELREVDAANRERNDETCATHDFCDANEVMLEAFEVAFGREMRLGEDVEGSDVDLDLANAAWMLAKRNGFSGEARK